MLDMDIRSLSIDWRLDHATIQREQFFGRFSFSAYHAVFVDPADISLRWTRDVPLTADGARRIDPRQDRGLGKTLSSWMSKRRTEAEDLLRRGGGVLVCRLRTRGEGLEIVSEELPSERIDRYAWLPTISLVDKQHQLSFPANGRFVPRHGDDVIPVDSDCPFARYFEQLEGHFVYDAIYEDLLSTPMDRFARVLATNRIGDVVALEIPFEEGRLVLVPPVQGVSPSREAAVLMEAVEQMAERPSFASEPDWLPSYPLPGEDGLADELHRLEERHASIDAKLDELRRTWEQTTRLKGMLHTRGRFGFVPRVAEGFEALGFEVELEGDLLRLRSEEGDALVVAEAADGPRVELPSYRTLLQATDQCVTDGEGHIKGILVASGSRALDPKRRPTQFSEAVLRGCTERNFCLLTSFHLFKLVQVALSSKGKGLAELRRALIECEGEFRGTESS